ncbi:DUF1214 domain-containing protein [Rhizobium sp. TRM95111]|uniref:DUF1214 domain-containing protein n=1 Tax=Rhizobium alarense TaxID=2846851 RepID=UPI001F41BC22|nr:DUF1214 domain-containing protein [Rhizobium alarense]MCF3642617.1 DUF1214 domain-containing protein [Rhizobium alarense]
MFRIPLLVALSLAVAFGFGTASTLFALRATVGFGAIALGSWVAFPNAQTADADPYAKAHRARDGALLFGSAEGLVFRTETDAALRTLTAACAYDLVGNTPPARFWTLHAEGRDGMPLKPEANRPAVLTSWSVLREADNRFVIHVGRAAMPGNWLALPEAGGRFRLVLTLLDTPTAGSSGVLELDMPALERRECADA